MSRLKNFSRNLATSYLQLVVNGVYSLVSVPLILHWLPKPEFGMWALLVQLMSYVALVDLGLTAAIGRFLIDHKDQRETGQYGALVKASLLVSMAQGAVVLLVVSLTSPLVASLMKIPAEYTGEFVALLRIQGVISAFTFCLNPLSILLGAHQRMDIVARQGMITLVVSLGLLLFFLVGHAGLYAFVYANAITAALVPWYLVWQCWHLGLLPREGQWGKTSWAQFRELFLYGKDVLLMNVGALLITASQTIIISRTLGLDAAAVWSVGTKSFMLLRQVQFQPYAAATAGLCEMVARREMSRLRSRFRELVVVCASLGVFLGVGFALCNSAFVSVWTNGKVAWLPLNDVLLAIWILLTALQMTHCNFIFITKDIGGMRYLYFIEGATFALLALGLGGRGGIAGVIAASNLCILLFSYQFGLRRSCRYFQAGFRELALEWVWPSLKFALVLVPLAGALWWATAGFPSLWRCLIHASLLAVGGFPLFLRLGLPRAVVSEAGSRLPPLAARWLGRLAGAT